MTPPFQFRKGAVAGKMLDRRKDARLFSREAVAMVRHAPVEGGEDIHADQQISIVR